MRQQFDAERGFTWVDPTLTVADIRAETQQRFEAIQDEQLKALMIQVAKISAVAKVDLDPDFASAVAQRAEMMADHAARKAAAAPDEPAPPHA